MNWTDTSILITGGTGSFGKKFTEIVLRNYLDNVTFVIASGAKQSPSTLGDCFGANSAPRNDTGGAT